MPAGPSLRATIHSTCYSWVCLISSLCYGWNCLLLVEFNHKVKSLLECAKCFKYNYILLDVLFCSIAKYFYTLCHILRFITQHAKLLWSCKQISCWSSGVQIPCDICTHFGPYFYEVQLDNKRSKLNECQPCIGPILVLIKYLHCLRKYYHYFIHTNSYHLSML